MDDKIFKGILSGGCMLMSYTNIYYLNIIKYKYIIFY